LTGRIVPGAPEWAKDKGEMHSKSYFKRGIVLLYNIFQKKSSHEISIEK